MLWRVVATDGTMLQFPGCGLRNSSNPVFRPIFRLVGKMSRRLQMWRQAPWPLRLATPIRAPFSRGWNWCFSTFRCLLTRCLWCSFCCWNRMLVSSPRTNKTILETRSRSSTISAAPGILNLSSIEAISKCNAHFLGTESFWFCSRTNVLHQFRSTSKSEDFLSSFLSYCFEHDLRPCLLTLSNACWI